MQYFQYFKPRHGLQQKVNMVKATIPSLEPGSLPKLVRHTLKESKALETRKKGKMITKIWDSVFISLGFT